MKCTILHESRGRLRVHVCNVRMTLHRADVLEAYLNHHDAVSKAKVYERTGDVVVYYTGSRKDAVAALSTYRFDDPELDALVTSADSRRINQEYQEKMYNLLAGRVLRELFLPAPLNAAYTVFRSIKFLWKGVCCLWRRKLEVEVLDALSIGVSILRGDFATAGSVMFLLNVGSLLEEWTRKKSLDDLARSMALNVDKVWVRAQGTEVLMPLTKVHPGDEIVVRSGNMIPLDGTVIEGEAMVNQAALTGESMPVRKTIGATVYAGTVVEEGECVLTTKAEGGANRYDKIVAMIEESEKLKSSTENRALALADRLVPWCLGATVVTYALTRNATRAISCLMVDFSCALKLSMPLAVLSAMRECGASHITVKGGKYLETLSKADTIVFDKTGTLTQGTFKVVRVCPVEGGTEDSLVEAAALAESWSKHPISLSIKAAYGKDIDAARVTDVEELGGHGVTAKVDGKTVAAGNARLMAKLGLTVPDVPQTGTIVHVAIDGKYAGYLLISDVVKPHSAQAIKGLKQAGVRKTVMLTGDAEPVAKAVSAELGIDEYHAGLLPGDKVDRIEKLLAAKNPKEMLAFVGDGINDAPVLSRVDVGIAMGALGSDAAIEAADVVLMDDDPAKIALAMRIARRTKSIVYQNIVFALAIKAACLLLGALGIANMWAAIFADVGVMVLAVLNATRALYTKDLTKK